MQREAQRERKGGKGRQVSGGQVEEMSVPTRRPQTVTPFSPDGVIVVGRRGGVNSFRSFHLPQRFLITGRRDSVCYLVVMETA